ncbi:protein translocase subunit SecF [Paenibacillus sp. N1-5-1-14]|uniref:protein translocase subunit SecF n=1 Tax=Paenibacillus radicibacter TaxID=2972488 RepID=UPI0021594A74|nr:protein translocase subunit SecF [Paenibacillus radicibacter]MCR8644105.1 protein translocase subunit SecF [Paenibacillus radicibacter]
MSSKSRFHLDTDSGKNRFDFMNHRKIFFIISIAITVLGLVMILFKGLHYGVDFKAGSTVDIRTTQSVDKVKAEQVVKDAGFSDVILTVGGDNNHQISARFEHVLDDPSVKKIETVMKAAFGNDISTEVNIVPPDIAQELGLKAIYAIAIASIAICIYVSIRFEWRFALAAIIAILHDAFITVSVFSIFQLKVDIPFIAAILTIIGYSINDKIVIFDRIRENQRFAKLKTSDDLSRMINNSIWQTMARNINTVFTVLIAAVCLFIFGSESIKLFALAKIIGLISGAYSSICIASPLWFLFKRGSVGSKRKPAALAKE